MLEKNMQIGCFDGMEVIGFCNECIDCVQYIWMVVDDCLVEWNVDLCDSGF